MCTTSRNKRVSPYGHKLTVAQAHIWFHKKRTMNASEMEKNVGRDVSQEYIDIYIYQIWLKDIPANDNQSYF